MLFALFEYVLCIGIFYSYCSSSTKTISAGLVGIFLIICLSIAGVVSPM